MHPFDNLRASATSGILFIGWTRLHEVCDNKMGAHVYQIRDSPLQPLHRTPSSRLPCASTMTTKPQQPKEKNKRALIALNIAISGLSIVKEASSMTPAAAAISSVTVLLTIIKVCVLLCDKMLQVHTQPGLDGQRSGLRRARIILF